MTNSKDIFGQEIFDEVELTDALVDYVAIYIAAEINRRRIADVGRGSKIHSTKAQNWFFDYMIALEANRPDIHDAVLDRINTDFHAQNDLKRYGPGHVEIVPRGKYFWEDPVNVIINAGQLEETF